MRDRFKPCSVEGCDGNAHYTARGVKGWCRKHYRRWQNHGDPVAGRPSPFEEMQWLVDHQNHEADECLIWPFRMQEDGRGMITVNGRTHAASRVMCQIVNGEAPSPIHQAAHSCGNGNGGCVHPEHLSWKTPKANQADRICHGTMICGEAHQDAKLSDSDVQQIRSLKGQLSQRQIASLYGVSQPMVSQIHLKKRWRHLKEVEDGNAGA